MNKSPKIIDLTWGNIIVEGTEKAYKDAKLFPGGSREWDWKETDTHHHPGVQPTDVQELIDSAAEVIVLTKGHLQRLEIQAKTLEHLNDAGVRVIIEETGRAVIRYNEMVEDNKKVGALIHSTC